ncbi:hypothetical protein Clacol_007975 [Clathrus columnatus]|uniref:Uncharacterized protein n=1 Tax=Clathrus columnatus TaxID=1419009 RepID=A0AAV5ALY3_9AGAM|nr:hypothetical protein Clacol_007975 [Clathrus columnatus]
MSIRLQENILCFTPKLWKIIEVVLDLKIPFVILVSGIPKFGEIGTMPDHIAEQIKASPERALTCKWAPQQAVLAHKATGVVFNTLWTQSCVEYSFSRPMIGWPLDAEQPGTATLITLKLDIAFELIEVRSGLGLKPMYRGCQPKGEQSSKKRLMGKKDCVNERIFKN